MDSPRDDELDDIEITLGQHGFVEAIFVTLGGKGSINEKVRFVGEAEKGFPMQIEICHYLVVYFM